MRSSHGSSTICLWATIPLWSCSRLLTSVKRCITASANTVAQSPIFTIDFQNDAKFVNGCIAGGRNYLHINANGDIEPCAFIHYSDSNIREKTLLEAYQSPLFMAYHDGQPFNDNMFQPCPMLENPECLRSMVKKSGAHSTEYQSPESVDHLCDKTTLYAETWKPKADELWAACQGCSGCKK